MDVTIRDLARKTGYTLATVSRALNSSPLVAEKTRREILRVADEIGYVPNAIARGLVANKTSTVGVLVPDITNPYFPVIVKAIQDKMYQNGYNVLLCNNDWSVKREMEQVKMLYAHRVSGIILDPLTDGTYQAIRKMGIKTPLVFTGNRPVDDSISFVLIDNYKGSVMAMEYLLELGHRRIAFIGAAEDTFTNRSRLNGYRDVLISRFGAVDAALIRKCRYSRADGFKAARSLISDGIIPDAVLCANDDLAFSVVECFRRHSINVPRDVSVIGFDDIDYASSIGLTTVREPRYEIGSTAAKILYSVMSNEDGADQNRQVVFEPELIKRDTCARKLPQL